MKNSKQFGATLFEILIVVAVIGILASILIPQLGKLRDRQVLKSATVDIVSAIDKARAQSVSSLGPSEYGVHFDSDKVVIFRGKTYAVDTQSNEPIDIIKPAIISNISLTDGVNDIYFNRIFNIPSTTGSITVSVGSISKIITIGATGVISSNNPN